MSPNLNLKPKSEEENIEGKVLETRTNSMGQSTKGHTDGSKASE